MLEMKLCRNAIRRASYVGKILIMIGLVTGSTSPLFGQVFTRITDGQIGTDQSHTFGVSWVDFDNDGDLDLFVAAAATGFGNLVYRNEGDGNFTRITDGVLANDPGIAVVGTCWADYDNDGDLDVFNAGVPNSFLYRNDGRGEFTKIEDGDIGDNRDRRGWSCAWGDYNEDGFVDLFIAHPTGFLGAPSTNSLFLNNGDGSFSEVTDTPITSGLAPYTVGNWIDYDDDGDIDLFIGSGPVANLGQDFLYRNQLSETGSATFERITDSPLNDLRDGQTWNFIDYDNDGDRDGFVTNYLGGTANGLVNNFYRNDAGIFNPITEGAIVTDEGRSLANVWADFDNDADLDVFITSEFGTDNIYYRNDGAPEYTFTRTTDFDGTAFSNYGASAGDFDLDGDLDLFFPSGFFGGNHFYRNDIPPSSSWINVRLVGTASNAAGVGAQVRAQATIDGETVWQRREVSTQNTFNGHNSLNVHYGFSDASSVSQLEISWPSGLVEVENNLEAGKFYVAIEGEGVITLAEYLLQILIHRVEALLSAGTLNGGQANSLLAQLNQAIKKIDAGQDHVAASAVGAFQNHVNDFLAEGILSDAEARDLLDPASNASKLLGGAGVASQAADMIFPVLDTDLPETFELAQNHPNPFNPSTVITFALPEESHVRLSIYDLQGRQVASLVDGTRNAGRHEVRWEPQGLASGLYLYRIEAGSYTQSRLLHLLK